MQLTRQRKLELIQRSLGLRHKLKVHDAMTAPENHEEQALQLLSKWELEDELNAIESLLDQSRNENTNQKRKEILEGKLALPKSSRLPIGLSSHSKTLSNQEEL